MSKSLSLEKHQKEIVRDLAALERMREASQTIDSIALKRLALICLRVAESAEADLPLIRKAIALADQWKALVKSATPPPRSQRKARSINKQAQALAGRMVGFLTTQLPLRSS